MFSIIHIQIFVKLGPDVSGNGGIRLPFYRSSNWPTIVSSYRPLRCCKLRANLRRSLKQTSRAKTEPNPSLRDRLLFQWRVHYKRIGTKERKWGGFRRYWVDYKLLILLGTVVVYGKEGFYLCLVGKRVRAHFRTSDLLALWITLDLRSRNDMEHLLYWSSALSRSSFSRYKKGIAGYLQNSMYFVQGHITSLPKIKTIAFASQYFTAAMIRSQSWFTFDFILHQIFWSPVLNDVKQLLIAAIMPSKVRFFHSGSLGIDDGPAIRHDAAFWKKIPSSCLDYYW